MRPFLCPGAGAQIPASEEMRESIAQMREMGNLFKENKKNTNKTRKGWLMPSGGSCGVSRMPPLLPATD